MTVEFSERFPKLLNRMRLEVHQFGRCRKIRFNVICEMPYQTRSIIQN